MDKARDRRHSVRTMVATGFRTTIGAALLCAGPALAQTAPPSSLPPQTLSLSDAQKADILSNQTESSLDAARAGPGGADGLGGGGRPQVHGEIGAAVGNHGLRDFYGTAAIPLGDHAGATVSVEDSRYSLRR